MLIEQLIGAAGLLLVQLTLRFGPAEPCTICVGELRGLIPLGSFLEAFQIDHVSHGAHLSSIISATGGAFGSCKIARGHQRLDHHQEKSISLRQVTGNCFASGEI